jgi:hypothetical protein
VPKSKPIEKPSERFKDAMRHILSVPKSELLKREAEYRNQRSKKAKREKP